MGLPSQPGLFFESGEPARIKLSRNGSLRLRRGYPWIYRNWIVSGGEGRKGQKCLVRSDRGQIIAAGFLEVAEQSLVARVLVRGQEMLTDQTVKQRIERAWRLREPLRRAGVTGYRVLHGEGDDLPGLVCDIYGSVCVLKLDGEGSEAFWNADALARAVVDITGCAAVVQRFRASDRFVVHGSASSNGNWDRVEFEEYGCRFIADVQRGQKTGFFFDQRENRRTVASFCHDKSVLNLFSYTGGFSVSAAMAGASFVTSVDSASPAIQFAEKNWQRNQLTPTQHRAVCEDVFVFLEQASQKSERYDVIIVDPPAFARSSKHLPQAIKAYERVFGQAMDVLARGGVIAFSSCSRHVSAEQFFEIVNSVTTRSERRFAVLADTSQPIDHPVPLACPELRYLKCVLLRSFE